MSSFCFLSCIFLFFFAAFSFVNIKKEGNTPSGMRDARMFLQVFHAVVLILKGLMLYISLHRCWMVSAVVMVLSCEPAVFTPDYKPSSSCNILLHSLTGGAMRKQKLVYLLVVLKISWLDASETYFIIDSPS